MKHTKICKNCGKKFVVANWRNSLAKYCSQKCYLSKKKTSKSYDKPRICEGCGKEFLPLSWYQKYCNRACFCKSETKRTKQICQTCGKEFMQVRLEQKFCSRKCSDPYRDKKLKKPRNINLDTLWSKKIKEIAGNKCEICGKETGLNSHHIFSRSNKRVRWDIDNGISLCVSHHVFGLFSAHKAPIEFIEYLKGQRGEEWYERLRKKANYTLQYEKITKEREEEIRQELKAPYIKI